MNWIAAPFGLMASASMAAAAFCHAAPSPEASQHSHHHSPEAPEKAPDPPGGCHAVLGCAAHRKLRTIP